MKLSNILAIFASLAFIGGLIMIAMGICFWLVTIGASGAPALFDNLIGLAVAILGALSVLAAFKIVQRIKRTKKELN